MTERFCENIGRAWGGASSILRFFLKPPPPTKTDAFPWGTPHLKIKPHPSEKQPPPQLKHETPFHEMIPRKSTINNNLKSS